MAFRQEHGHCTPAPLTAGALGSRWLPRPHAGPCGCSLCRPSATPEADLSASHGAVRSAAHEAVLASCSALPPLASALATAILLGLAASLLASLGLPSCPFISESSFVLPWYQSGFFNAMKKWHSFHCLQPIPCPRLCHHAVQAATSSSPTGALCSAWRGGPACSGRSASPSWMRLASTGPGQTRCLDVPPAGTWVSRVAAGSRVRAWEVDGSGSGPTGWKCRPGGSASRVWTGSGRLS